MQVEELYYFVVIPSLSVGKYTISSVQARQRVSFERVAHDHLCRRDVPVNMAALCFSKAYFTRSTSTRISFRPHGPAYPSPI